MPKTYTTQVRYNSDLHIRDGVTVVVVDKVTSIFPVTGRGKDYSNIVDIHETTVIPVAEVAALVSTLAGTLAYGVSDEYQNEPLENETEPKYVLAADDSYLKFWTFAEAISYADSQRHHRNRQGWVLYRRCTELDPANEMKIAISEGRLLKSWSE